MSPPTIRTGACKHTPVRLQTVKQNICTDLKDNKSHSNKYVIDVDSKLSRTHKLPKNACDAYQDVHEPACSISTKHTIAQQIHDAQLSQEAHEASTKENSKVKQALADLQAGILL